MFVTSFIPLWVTIIFLDIWDIVDSFKSTWDKNCEVSVNLRTCAFDSIVQIISIIVICIVSVISIIGIEKFIHKRNNSLNDKALITAAHKESALSVQYLLSYIVPLIAFDFGKLKDIIIFLLFFLTLAFLSIRNNNIYTNIYLEFRKYKIYTCNIERIIMDNVISYEDCFVLSKDDLQQYINEEITYWDFDTKHYIKT
jgi:hypothetical protein